LENTKLVTWRRPRSCS